MESIHKDFDCPISTLSANIVTPDGQKINVIKIPGEKKELAQIGISEGFVYPEIEYKSNELLENYFKQPSLVILNLVVRAARPCLLFPRFGNT